MIEQAFEEDAGGLTFRSGTPGETPWIAFGACQIAALAPMLEIGLSPAKSPPMKDCTAWYTGLSFRSGLGFNCGISVEEFVKLGEALENHPKPPDKMDRRPWGGPPPIDQAPTAREPVRVQKGPGRNQPCACGSGKKSKLCCGA
jgi:hypothetical protein